MYVVLELEGIATPLEAGEALTLQASLRILGTPRMDIHQCNQLYTLLKALINGS